MDGIGNGNKDLSSYCRISELTLILGQSLTPGLEFGLKWSGDRGVSQGNQVGIKIDIRTEEVQSKLLV